jgi:hypothetical protein
VHYQGAYYEEKIYFDFASSGLVLECDRMWGKAIIIEHFFVLY